MMDDADRRGRGHKEGSMNERYDCPALAAAPPRTRPLTGLPDERGSSDGYPVARLRERPVLKFA